MRKLATAAVSFSGAIVLAHFVLPSAALIWCAAFFAAASFLGLKFKEDLRLRVFLISLGFAAGFLWNLVYTSVYFVPAKALDGQIATVSAAVAGYPEKTDYGFRVTVKVLSPDHPDIKTQLYTYGSIPALKPGNSIQFTAKFRLSDTMYGESTDMFLSKGIFLSATLKSGITLTDDRVPVSALPVVIAHAVTEKITQIFDEDVAGFMKALIIGDTSEINRDTVLSGALSVTGTAHIISVSGMNIAFLMGVLALLIKNRRLLAAVGIPVVLIFMAVVGFQAPVTRAGIMQIFLLAAPLFKRETDAITSLSAALLLLLLLNPFSIGSIGLQLSFSATLGIIVCTRRIYDRFEAPLRDKKIYEYALLKEALRFIIATSATTAGALVFSVPLLALHFGSISLIAPLANIAVLWAVTLAFIGGIVSVIAGLVCNPIGTVAATVVALPARFVIRAVSDMSHIPFAAIYTMNTAVVAWLVTAYLMIAAFLLLHASLRRLLLPVCLSVVTLCLIMLLTSIVYDKDKLSVTALNVGQGQSVVITSGSFTEVVDCGGSGGKDAADVLIEYLQSRGRTSIDLLVLTHYHTDHADGVAKIMELGRVSSIAVPDPSIDDGLLPEEIIRLAAAKGIKLFTVTEDMRFVCGATALTLYAPYGDEGENERGLAVLCTEDGFDALITGDMNDDIESRLIANKHMPDIELLVAGHHGSKHSTGQSLLDAIKPETAVISVGWNTYGHPAPETLDRLANAGIAVFRTDFDGNVTIKSSENSPPK